MQKKHKRRGNYSLWLIFDEQDLSANKASKNAFNSDNATIEIQKEDQRNWSRRSGYKYHLLDILKTDEELYLFTYDRKYKLLARFTIDFPLIDIYRADF